MGIAGLAAGCAALGLGVRAEAQISKFHNYSGVFLYMGAAPSVLSQASLCVAACIPEKRGAGMRLSFMCSVVGGRVICLAFLAVVMLTWA